MTAIGIGCRKGCPAASIVALIRRALADPALAGAGMMAVFTTIEKQSEPGIAAAAAALSLPLVYLPRAALEAVAPSAQTRSERVVELFGVPSVAETAALAGAGPGARLLVPRISADGASCAVAGPAEPSEQTS
ncbi:cobalamin biosynthesis protein CobE [Alsobacter soli]|uniref:Cobalamin biosynthesis protein CobE n=2 Tax=Alsobacter soli TaxID=2109933 RepID=A0A2T1HYI9_9HYPH|nr:cobalamin biosynthesis protein CobE [Alsobacter soli]